MNSLCSKERLYKVIKRVVDQSAYKSYTLFGGSPSSYYMNIDWGLTSYDLGPTISDCYTDRIEGLKRDGLKIERLAFIRRQDTSQPTGAITLMVQIVRKTKIPALIINLTQIGKPQIADINAGEHVLIISDNATTGQEIKEATKALRSKRAIVSKALVFFDREEGAEKNLARENIKLETIVSKSELVRQAILRQPEEDVISDKLDQLLKALKRYRPRWEGKTERELESLLVRRLKGDGFEVKQQVLLEKSTLTIDIMVDHIGIELKIPRSWRELNTLDGQLRGYLDDLTQIVAVVFIGRFLVYNHIERLKSRLMNTNLLNKRVFIIEK
jgi:orotate phosphoribosyltransferase